VILETCGNSDEFPIAEFQYHDGSCLSDDGSLYYLMMDHFIINDQDENFSLNFFKKKFTPRLWSALLEACALQCLISTGQLLRFVSLFYRTQNIYNLFLHASP